MADTLSTRDSLSVNGKNYTYYSINKAAEAIGADFARLPFSLKVLLENLLRYEDGNTVKVDDIKALATWLKDKKAPQEIAYRPARVLMQDFTGVPAVVDLAAMRDAVANLGADATKINPQAPVDLVIDHSVMVDKFGTDAAFEQNVALEMERNRERYEFLKWGQNAFDNFSVVPPGTGICHQVNLEYLAKVVWTKEENGETVAYPDTLVGTDSHTTMINGLAVLGWGVGGIEAEAAMLGQPISMLIPEVIGFKLTGALSEGTTATDLVLTVTQMLREKGVVGKFVEFYGEGLKDLPLADRATIANMAPEYGATCGFFPVDDETLKYLKLSARDEQVIALAEAYAKAQGMWREDGVEPVFTDTLALDMGDVEPSMAGPKRPQDKITLKEAKPEFMKLLGDAADGHSGEQDGKDEGEIVPSKSRVSDGMEGDLNDEVERGPDHPDFAGHDVAGRDFQLRHGNVMIAAITSCTNTSNPSVMLAAGLVARKALEKGLSVKPWVKTSLAPGSKVVTEYLEAAGLQDDLDKLGFNLVGYGCTTCIGNSGPLDKEIEDCIKDNKLVVTSVLSGNRNFEGRVHALTTGNYLMSPPLVVAYAIAGTMALDLANDVIGQDKDGNDVTLQDIWPSNQEIAELVGRVVTPQMFKEKYADVFSGTKEWQAIDVANSLTYPWDNSSTYIQNPPYFEGMTMDLGTVGNIESANILALLGDSITTDHISPAGAIAADGPAAKYLKENGVERKDFNSFGSRRGNHEVMMRGTFANVRIRNEMAPGTEGGYTTYVGNGEVMPIYDAAMRYKEHGRPLVVIGGKDYGMGSSRDWAAKGTILLGVKAVIAESFERIHRSNLVGMGVLPLTFLEGMNRTKLNLDGTEEVSVRGLENGITPKMELEAIFKSQDGTEQSITVLCRIDTEDEVGYFNNGGILHNVVRDLAG